jgi:hypothetical protein
MNFPAIYVLAVAGLCASAPAAALSDHQFVAFQDADGFTWGSSSEAQPVTGECQNGESMVMRDIVGTVQLNSYTLSIIFCQNDASDTTDINDILNRALADLKRKGERAIMDRDQRDIVVGLLTQEATVGR